jgi:hypothetical protein
MRQAEEEKPPEPPAGRQWSPKERFLLEVRRHPELATACEKAGVTWQQVERWKRSEAFAKELEFAQMVFLGTLQQSLVDIARGRIKGNPNAAGWILNANHPAYGRVKAELILRVLDPLTKAYGAILLAELGGGQDAKNAIERADKRFEAVKMARLTDFT